MDECDAHLGLGLEVGADFAGAFVEGFGGVQCEPVDADLLGEEPLKCVPSRYSRQALPPCFG